MFLCAAGQGKDGNPLVGGSEAAGGCRQLGTRLIRTRGRRRRVGRTPGR
jgi:hypothetical protein